MNVGRVGAAVVGVGPRGTPTPNPQTRSHRVRSRPRGDGVWAADRLAIPSGTRGEASVAWKALPMKVTALAVERCSLA